MAEHIDALLAYMADAGEQARHHENQRSSFTAAGLGFAGAIATLAAGSGGLPLIVGGLAVTLLGAFGLALSLKSYERNRFHVKAFELTRKAVDAVLVNSMPPPTMTEIRSAAELVHKEQFRLLFSVQQTQSDNSSAGTPSALIGLRLNRLWLIAWLLVILGGIVMAVAGGSAL